PSSFGQLLFSQPDAAAAVALLGITGGVTPGSLTFDDIAGTISLSQFPPGSVATVDTIGQDALYFFTDSTGLPSLASALDTAAFLSGSLTFSDLSGTIALSQFPDGSVAALDSIDEDALYFFDDTLFLPRLIS